MTNESRYHKNHSVSFFIPDNYQTHPRTISFADSDFTYESTISTISPTALTMVKSVRNVKTLKKIWDSDKAIKSTYKGLFGIYQLRAYLFLALGYGIVAAWLTQMPTFALLLPKYVNCTPYYPDLINQTSTELNETTLNISDLNSGRIIINGRIQKIEPIYDYSKDYGRTVVTDFNVLCNKTRLKIPYIVYIIGLILGSLILGYLADHSGRKMVLLGSIWTACALSIFQLLSDDYISYIFFIFFLGCTIGAIHVITIPYIMEMFPSESRAIYGLSVLGIVFLLDLVIPWLALVIKNWKILQAIITIPLILTAALYWFMEESMFWYTAQKDYNTAVLSLIKISQFNGVIFEDIFREAREFLRGKYSKEVQCDFQPLLRLEDIKTLGTKYPDFDMVDIKATTGKKTSLLQHISQIISGHHYSPKLSTFYPSDIFHSPILSLYLLIMCGLWLVSSLTEYSLDVQHLTQYLTENFYKNYFYTRLIEIISFVIALPLVHIWGRRWPTFCFFLIAEVCLLGSVAVKLDDQQIRAAMLIVYFIGKFATRAAYIVIIIYTCEIFPTGLRCTTLGICYTFRLIGVALASPDLGEVNDWMPRLIYGILSLILGALALLLPETKQMPLPRTMITIESIPTSISQHFRRRRSIIAKKTIQANKTHPTGGLNNFNDTNSIISGVRSIRPYDNQSTIHSVFELQELGHDDTTQTTSNRHTTRRIDSRNPTLYQPYNGSEFYRPKSIAEDAEYDNEDLDDDQTRITLQRDLNEQQQHGVKNSVFHKDDDEVDISPVKSQRESTSDEPSQLEITAQIQSGDVTGDRSACTTTTDDTKENLARNVNLSQSPRYQRAMSQDENYFSEHC